MQYSEIIEAIIYLLAITRAELAIVYVFPPSVDDYCQTAVTCFEALEAGTTGTPGG